jgi:hypothetical protein
MIFWLDAARGLRELYPAPAHRIVLIANTTSASLCARNRISIASWNWIVNVFPGARCIVARYFEESPALESPRR